MTDYIEPSDSDLHAAPQSVQEYIANLKQENSELEARVAELEQGIRNCRVHAVDNGVCTKHFNNHVHDLLTRKPAQSLAALKADAIQSATDAGYKRLNEQYQGPIPPEAYSAIDAVRAEARAYEATARLDAKQAIMERAAQTVQCCNMNEDNA